MLFLISAPSRLKADKVVIGYPDIPDSDSPLFPELIVNFEVGVKNRLAGRSPKIFSKSLFFFFLLRLFTLCSLCVSSVIF